MVETTTVDPARAGWEAWSRDAHQTLDDPSRRQRVIDGLIALRQRVPTVLAEVPSAARTVGREGLVAGGLAASTASTFLIDAPDALKPAGFAAGAMWGGYQVARKHHLVEKAKTRLGSPPTKDVEGIERTVASGYSYSENDKGRIGDNVNIDDLSPETRERLWPRLQSGIAASKPKLSPIDAMPPPGPGEVGAPTPSLDRRHTKSDLGF